MMNGKFDVVEFVGVQISSKRAGRSIQVPVRSQSAPSIRQQHLLIGDEVKLGDEDVDLSLHRAH